MDFFHPEDTIDYEAYWCMLDKIIYSSEKVQKTLVFKMFDVNEDHYICFTDMHHAMINATTISYNSDISTIEEN